MNGNQQEIVEVYVKKDRKPQQTSASKAKGKYNKNKQNDSYQQDQQEQYYLDKNLILQKFNNQENEERIRLNQQQQQQSCQISIEEEKQDFEVKIKTIQEFLGDDIGKKAIKNALRACNMDLDNTIDYLTNNQSNSQQNGNNNNNSNQHQNGQKMNNIYSSSTSGSSENSHSNNNNNLILRQGDSEERLKMNTRMSSESDKQLRIKYESEIQNIKDVVKKNLKEEIIIEALEMHQGNLDETTNYLLDDGNVKSLEVCLLEHNQDLNQVDIHLEEIVDNIIQEEDEQLEYQFMMELQNEEEYDDLNVEDDLYLTNIKRSLSYEEQQDPEVQKFFKMSAIFAKQLEIMNSINEKKNSGESPERLHDILLKKNYSNNLMLHLEQFKEDQIRNDNKKNKNQYVMKESDFPSMVKKPSGYNGNIVKQLQKSNQLEYNPNANQWNTTVFQHDDNVSALGQEYLQDLSSRFPHVDRETLVDIFKDLSENYEATQSFLTKHFGKSNIKQEVKIIRKPKELQKHSSYYDGENEEDEDYVLDKKIKEYEKKYGELSFKDIRKEIVNQYKYNKAYQYAEKNSDFKAKLNLNKYLQANTMSLYDMKEYSKVIFLREIRSQLPMTKVDLHGFYAEEALEILKDQIMYMKKLARQNRVNSLKIINKQIQLEIVTGRGSHSINKVSVLKPTVLKFLSMTGYQYKAEEGRIFAKIPY